MTFFHGWIGWRRFKRLDWEWRNIVVYSESGQDWHQFSGLIESLNSEFGLKVTYVTSDPNDPGLGTDHPEFQSILIPEGLFQTIFFQVCQCDVFVLTMMDLDNLHLKRSLHDVWYVYLFHSMGSTHMVDNENSYDHYDSLFCAGPHQVAEIRKREELAGLEKKHLFEYGHPRLEDVIRQGQGWTGTTADGSEKTILVAPTWGDDSIFNTCGEELIRVLLEAGYRVIMRPHYQSCRITPEVIDGLRETFSVESRFEYIDQMGETDSIMRSDCLVTDWSAMSMEYSMGLEKPVLFIDLPKRVRNRNWRDLGLESVEITMRAEVGEVISPEELDAAPRAIQRLLANPEQYGAHMADLRRRFVFRLGDSVPAGAAEIARLAGERLEVRKNREAANG